MVKPEGCIGCPLYDNGQGFVPDQIIPGSDTMILMQNPGATEEQYGVPAIGDTGKLMNEVFIPLAGLYRQTNIVAPTGHVDTDSDISVANVLKCRWRDSDGNFTNSLPSGDVLEAAVAHCTDAHLYVPEHIKYVVAQGSLAFNYITDGAIRESDGKPSGVNDWRGNVLPVEYMGRPVFQVLHLADLYRDPKQRWVAEQDWKRIRAFREGRYPAPVPDRIIVKGIEEWGHAHEWFRRVTADGGLVYCDTEFIPDSGYLTVLGLGTRDPNGCIQGLQIDFRGKDGYLRRLVGEAFHTMVRSTTVVFHNAMADIPILEKNLAVPYTSYKSIEDTMLAHSVLWGELPHTLDFCGSIYNQFPRLKNLAGDDLLYYNWGDVLATLSVWDALTEDLHWDTGADAVYRSQLLQLVPILIDAKHRGIRVNEERLLEVQPVLAQGMDLAMRLARVGSGRIAINLGSDDQLKDWFYRVQEYPVQKNKDTKRPTTDDDAIGVLREHVGPPFDSKVDLTFDTAIDRVLAGADPVLEARVLFVQHEHILNNYIYPLHSEVANANGTAKANIRKRLHNSGGQWIRGITVVRIFPQISIHVQKSGRHSTSDPPLAQLPAEYRDIIIPDIGTVWLKWDWSAIEPRLLEALCGSKILKRSFDDNIDLHTWTVCEVFGYPQPPDLINPHKCKCGTGVCEHEQWRQGVAWKGKEDPRRTFAKAGRYEVWYGGTGSNAAAAAARFGLDKRLLKAAVQKLASSDPDYYAWRGGIEAETKRTRIVRSWGGRPRRLLGQGNGVIREALNHPMQAGVSDIYNLTIIELAARYPFAQFMFGMHDSQWYQIPMELLTEEVFNGFRQVVEQERNINGVIRAFPADFELTDCGANYYGKSHDLSIAAWLTGERYMKMCGCNACKGRTYRGT